MHTCYNIIIIIKLWLTIEYGSYSPFDKHFTQLYINQFSNIYLFFFQIIPLIHTVSSVIESQDVTGSGLMGLKNDIIASIKRRYPSVESNLALACSTLLDPRFKQIPFKDNDMMERAKAKIVLEMDEGEECTNVNVNPPVVDCESSNNSAKKQGGSIINYVSTLGPIFLFVNILKRTKKAFGYNKLKLRLSISVIRWLQIKLNNQFRLLNLEICIFIIKFKIYSQYKTKKLFVNIKSKMVMLNVIKFLLLNVRLLNTISRPKENVYLFQRFLGALL